MRIQSGVGLRSGQQGYGVANNVRQGYGLTEKDAASGNAPTGHGGLNHTWFRKHENRAGRWTSPDPYKGSMRLGDPQSFNRLAYVTNDPVNFVDPSGLFSIEGGWDGWWPGEFFRFWLDSYNNRRFVHSRADESRGGGGGSPPLNKKCKETFELPAENTDVGAMARLIFQEATNQAAFANTSDPLKNYSKELLSVEAAVLNRVAFLNQPGLKQSETLGFGSVGATLQDVIFSNGKNPNGSTNISQQFAGFSRDGTISASIRNRVKNALNSPATSDECQKLRTAWGMARSPTSPEARVRNGVDNVYAFRTAGSGAPGGRFYALPQIPGSGNTFYGLKP